MTFLKKNYVKALFIMLFSLSVFTCKKDKEEPTPAYTIFFDTNGGTPIPPPQTVNNGSKIKAPTPTPTKKGHAFDKWYTEKKDGKEVTFPYPVSFTTVLYARWIADQYTVKFDTDGGPTIADQTIDHGNRVDKPATDPKKTGYTFDNWYTKKEDGKEVKFPITVTKNITIFTLWTINQYTIKFDTDRGSPIADKTVDYNTPVDKPTPDPAKPKTTFDGWYTEKEDGKKVDFNAPITKNITMYARWTKYTVTFNANNDDAKPTITTKQVDYNTPVAKPTTDPVGKPEPTAIFNGWYTAKKDGEKVDFSASITKDVTIYAQWTINVTFDAQNGSATTTEKVDYNTPVDKPEKNPKKKGSTFDGWYTEKEDGEKVDFSAPITKAVTIYAHWK